MSSPPPGSKNARARAAVDGEPAEESGGLLSRVTRGLRRRVADLRTSNPRSRARRAEARGDLEDATALYMEAGEMSEAARLFALRAETTQEARSRLNLLAQAASVATGETAADLQRRRAKLALDLARAGTIRLSSSELSDLGHTLEELDESVLAASAFSLAGDVEAQTRSLVAAGAIERLEEVLHTQEAQARQKRRLQQLYQRVFDLRLAGRRREALAIARSEGLLTDERAAALVREIDALRAEGPTTRLVVDGSELEVAFGDSITIGRADATITVASPSVSRAHLGIRRASGRIEAFDLGSRNGTFVAGARVEVPVGVGAGLELLLGGDVPMRIEPHGDAVRVEIAGRNLYAPLGPLEIGAWRVEPGDDDWLELSADPAAPVLLGELRVDPVIELCRGDELRERPAGDVRLRV